MNSIVLTFIPPLIALLLTRIIQPSSIRIADPSYRTQPSRQCHAPNIYPRHIPLSHTCLDPLTTGSHSINLRIHVPQHNQSYLLTLAPSLHSLTITHSQSVNLSNLLADTDYTISLTHRHLAICRIIHSTYPHDNLILNPSFESSAVSPFLATRFHYSQTAAPRQWTPFYNGGAARICGPIPVPHSNAPVVAGPRSGHCVLYLGQPPNKPSFAKDAQYYGAHQSVSVRDSYALVSLWYLTSPQMVRFAPEQRKSPHDSLAIVINYLLNNLVPNPSLTIPLSPSTNWTNTCIILSAPADQTIQIVHLYLHMHEYQTGALLIDDVSITAHSSAPPNQCRIIALPTPLPLQTYSPTIHLKAHTKPHHNQLTLAVPMTTDRILRLEAMSRLYGGGPIVAAVCMRSPGQRHAFEGMWRRKKWLHQHVDVSFVECQHPLPINRIRNIALQMASTRYLVMLDVDMVPATQAFACFRDTNATFLNQLLKRDKSIATLPVFISDIHHRSATDKDHLLNLLCRRRGTIYCINSQKPLRLKRWYTNTDAVQTRFLTDYEPYGIVRRDAYLAYDERFRGYGFNKISWAVAAEKCRWSLIVLPHAFVTHLNHVENDWVRDIDVEGYLTTWRSFLAYVAELEDVHVGRRLCERYSVMKG